MKSSSKWTRETILALLERNDITGWRAVERALVQIYDRQTADEKSAEVTKHVNSVGFAGCDAERGSWLVKTVIRENKARGLPEGRRLRGKAFLMAQKIVKRYAGTQLLKIARQKEKEMARAIA